MPQYHGRSKAGLYGDFVAQVDDSLGQIMEALDSTGLARNTLLILTSDNGADWRPEDAARYAHQANARWRGRKADAWEAGHRVPFIARWPGRIPAGSVSNQLGCLTDLLATAAAIHNKQLPSNAGEDSYYLLPALLGQAKSPIRPDVVLHSNRGYFVLRRGPWKLIQGLGSGGFSEPHEVEPAPGGPQGQLYNLEEDPTEVYNLYQRRPDIVEELSAILKKYHQQGYSRPM